MFFVSQDSLTGDKNIDIQAILTDFVLRNYKMVTQLFMGTVYPHRHDDSQTLLSIFF